MTIIRLLAGLLLAGACAAPAWAQPGPPMLPPPPGMMRHGEPPLGPMPFGDDPALMLPALLQGVGLTDEQRAQVRDVLQANREGLFTRFEQLRSANQALADALVSTDPVSEETLQPLLDRVVRLRGEIMRQGLRVVLQVRALLTAEQLARAAEVKGKLRELHEQMRALLGKPELIPLGDPD